jgi:hypothetical protein
MTGRHSARRASPRASAPSHLRHNSRRATLSSDRAGCQAAREDKRARLRVAARYIKNGTVKVPRKECEQLLTQLLGFGVEKHDDVADALVYLILDFVGEGISPHEIHYVKPSYSTRVIPVSTFVVQRITSRLSTTQYSNSSSLTLPGKRSAKNVGVISDTNAGHTSEIMEGPRPSG